MNDNVPTVQWGSWLDSAGARRLLACNQNIADPLLHHFHEPGSCDGIMWTSDQKPINHKEWIINLTKKEHRVSSETIDWMKVSKRSRCNSINFVAKSQPAKCQVPCSRKMRMECVSPASSRNIFHYTFKSEVESLCILWTSCSDWKEFIRCYIMVVHKNFQI